MPRRPSYKIRKNPPDAKYGSRLISNFVCRMMIGGKKSTAERVIYDALDIIAEKHPDEPVLDIFKKAIKNASPIVKVKARRIGGSTYQVPMEVSPSVSEAISHRWIINATRKRSGKSFAQKLASELMDAASNQGAAIRKKEETHRMAEANKAFAHYGKY
jgi:small subunit ribosomal protein S7